MAKDPTSFCEGPGLVFVQAHPPGGWRCPADCRNGCPSPGAAVTVARCPGRAPGGCPGRGGTVAVGAVGRIHSGQLATGPRAGRRVRRLPGPIPENWTDFGQNPRKFQKTGMASTEPLRMEKTILLI